MKWRAFSRMPQWVRLSEVLGVAEPNATPRHNLERRGLKATNLASGYFSAALLLADAPV